MPSRRLQWRGRAGFPMLRARMTPEEGGAFRPGQGTDRCPASVHPPCPRSPRRGEPRDKVARPPIGCRALRSYSLVSVATTPTGASLFARRVRS
jgi:hypothetical protein